MDLMWRRQGVEQAGWKCMVRLGIWRRTGLRRALMWNRCFSLSNERELEKELRGPVCLQLWLRVKKWKTTRCISTIEVLWFMPARLSNATCCKYISNLTDSWKREMQNGMTYLSAVFVPSSFGVAKPWRSKSQSGLATCPLLEITTSAFARKYYQNTRQSAATILISM